MNNALVQQLQRGDIVRFAYADRTVRSYRGIWVRIAKVATRDDAGLIGIVIDPATPEGCGFTIFKDESKFTVDADDVGGKYFYLTSVQLDSFFYRQGKKHQ